ncbi:MAG: hypothetical protein PUG70_03560 [Lachnospiraceae bacterium]|nr:hypothetical protein [Lachnospiraceae bacterium]MDY5522340.1 hypothetical protein [Agathobacter sp.]
MKRVRLGVCIADREFSDRFVNCLVKHYRNQLELHMFTELSMLWEAIRDVDVALLEAQDLCEMEGGADWSEKPPCPVVALFDSEEMESFEEKGGVYLVEKYQEVNKIVDEIMKHIGEEIRNVTQNGSLPARARTIAVYSLSENEYQLPLAMTLASILSEQEKVLLLDLQENSGLSQVAGDCSGTGLEELLVMLEGGKFSLNRMVACVGHMDRLDYVYPAGNTECLCETSAATYQQLIRVLSKEMGYHTVILNLGSRFAGFFEMLEACQTLYLLKNRGGLGKWRQKEFEEELQKHGLPQSLDWMQEIAIPVATGPVISCERLVEQWKWNDMGDSIRRMMPEVMSCG